MRISTVTGPVAAEATASAVARTAAESKVAIARIALPETTEAFIVLSLLLCDERSSPGHRPTHDEEADGHDEERQSRPCRLDRRRWRCRHCQPGVDPGRPALAGGVAWPVAFQLPGRCLGR